MHASLSQRSRPAAQAINAQMPHIVPIDPLHLHPSIRTTDPDEFRAAVTTLYGARDLHVPNPHGLRTRGNLVKLNDAAIGFSACGARAIVTFDECDYARLQIPLAGHAATTSNGTTTNLHTGNTCVTSPGQSATLDYGNGFEHLVLRLSTGALTRKLGILLDARPAQPLAFHPTGTTDDSADRALRNLLWFVIRQIDEGAEGLPAAVMQELEQAMIVAFLTGRQHGYSEHLMRSVRDAAPWQVRRAEAYIEANWDQAITIEKLAEATGVGIRTLFASFQKSRGYSPMQFAKTVRLTRARSMLMTPKEHTTVTGVALACGFANQGHFAREFRDAFGERPSQTLARARARI
ncbi:MAG: AraC family transcriptional regulator [Pseudomonadota bacterium]|jgi:AraC-like DNA-binding protein